MPLLSSITGIAEQKLITLVECCLLLVLVRTYSMSSYGGRVDVFRHICALTSHHFFSTCLRSTLLVAETDSIVDRLLPQRLSQPCNCSSLRTCVNRIGVLIPGGGMIMNSQLMVNVSMNFLKIGKFYFQ